MTYLSQVVELPSPPFRLKRSLSINYGSNQDGLNKGYRRITLDGRQHFGHRLAWLHVHGVWPPDQIDHINGARADNRIANLRPATHQQNASNRRRGIAGLKGAVFSKRYKRWRAQIMKNGRQHFLGHFASSVEAHAAYCRAAQELHGEFWNAG